MSQSIDLVSKSTLIFDSYFTDNYAFIKNSDELSQENSSLLFKLFILGLHDTIEQFSTDQMTTLMIHCHK